MLRGEVYNKLSIGLQNGINREHEAIASLLACHVERGFKIALLANIEKLRSKSQ